MEGKNQNQIAFFLTGKRSDGNLQPLDASYRPALFARFRDLASLRYDLPLVLNTEGPADRSLVSLSGMVDDPIDAMAEGPERDRAARHAYRIENAIRQFVSARGSADLLTLWNEAAERLSANEEGIRETAKSLWRSFQIAGEVSDADADLPRKAVRHAWSVVQSTKTREFKAKVDRLLIKLKGILDAEVESSPEGRSPDRLRAGVGSAFGNTFDFERMSRVLVESKPGIELSETRRERIRDLIEVLRTQRFYRTDSETETFNFAFDRCEEALKAYKSRHAYAVQLLKVLAIAELEVSGEYREAVHDAIFQDFGANALDPELLAKLPDYLVTVNSKELDPAESEQIIAVLAAGLPFRVLVQSDDILEPSAVAEGHVALGLRSRQIVDTAIGLTDVFVLQSSASDIVRSRESLMRGLSYDGPTLFSIFSGATGHNGDIPAYLVAAAAVESRAFPALMYDPSNGEDWASRLKVDNNPETDADWPRHELAFENSSLQVCTEEAAFTFADFLAMDERFAGHFAVLPAASFEPGNIPVTTALEKDLAGMPDEIPFVTLVDENGVIARAILDGLILAEVKRCRTMWRSLQELGGIHNSHAERLLAEERKSFEAAAVSAAAAVAAAPKAPTAAPAAIEAVSTEEAVKAPDVIESIEESHGDDPYIETPRCTSCNECTQINDKLFSYNENKQAFIADADAGTYRQLVEAAEGCQVSIIHPGKPRNPKEPGLDELIRRAEAFM